MSAKGIKQSKFYLIGYAAVSVLLAYGLFSLAIDRGNLFIYLLGFIALGYSIYFFKKFVTQQFKK